jgi:hypothetical protein
MAVVTATLKLNTTTTQTAAGIPGQATSLAGTQSMTTNLGSGTVLDAADLKYSKTLVFAASTAQNLDLSALTDVYGNAVNFARIRSISINVLGQVDGSSLTVGAAAANPWAAVLGATGTLTLFPATAANAGFFALTAPNTTGMVVSGTSKVLKLLPSAHAFSADVEIVGASV